MDGQYDPRQLGITWNVEICEIWCGGVAEHNSGDLKLSAVRISSMMVKDDIRTADSLRSPESCSATTQLAQALTPKLSSSALEAGLLIILHR